MRSLILLLVWFVVGSRGSAVEFPASQPELYRPLIERAIAAGMPDVRGATFWTGTWVAESDETDQVARFQGFWHLHLRLADGRWLMRGIYLRPAAEPAEMLAAGFSQVAADAEGTVTPFGDFVENPLFHTSGPNVALMPLAAFAGLRQASHPKLVRFGSAEVEEQWPPSPKTPEDPSTENFFELHARRDLHVVLLQQALAAASVADVRAFTTAALALMSDEERPVREVAVRRLLDLPPCAETPHPMPAWQIVQEWNGDRATWPRANPPSTDDLIALLDDERPARRLYWSMPMTIGDGAFTALTQQWGFHPRQVSGRDTTAPWTAEERRLTTLAIREWWRVHRDQPLLTAVLSDPTTVPLLWTSSLGRRLTPTEHTQAAAAVTRAWAALDQTGRDALGRDAVSIFHFENALDALGDNHDLDHLVRSWPVQGPLHLSLGLWHELRDNLQPLTDHLRDVLASDANVPLDESAKTVITGITSSTADQERCDLLIAAYQADPGSRPFALAHAIACSGTGPSYNKFHPLLRSVRFESRERATIRQVLHLIGLFDERLLPTDTAAVPLRVCDAVGRFGSASQDGEDGKDGEKDIDPALPIAERDRLLAIKRTKALARLPVILNAGGLKLRHPLAARLSPAAFPSWWKAELDAARAEKKALVLLLTDTVVCAPCIRLEREVLSQPAWTTWAATQVRMVVLDESKHRDDREWWQRVLEVTRIYEFGGGVPSLILVDADGKRLSKRYAFHPGMGPEWYIAEFTRALAKP